jgi:two-component system cell cycle sensor histidine kinase/response regulator CckA
MGVERGDPVTGQHTERDSELESRLVAIVESSDDAILGKTLDGVITSWNAGAERIYGFAADEMIGSNVSEIVPPDRLAELGPIIDRLRGGERVNHFETKRRRKDGAIIDVSVCISPIRDRGGVVVGASSVARDVTEHNRQEAERRALEQGLYRAERLDTLGQLAGGIAHDFNNLLAVILSYAGFVIEETADRPAVRADAEQVLTAAQRAATLTRQLLIFSRREEIRLAELDLDAVIADMLGLLRTSVGAQVEVRVGPAAESAAIVADRGQIEQVLLNLAVNARDAMPGGGTLTMGTSLAELSDEYARLHPGVSPGRYVELALTDTGTGMGAEVAARIFEPFFTTKPLGEGTGLGLSTVYGIVIQSGGSMTVDSEEGTGTTFRVYFPAVGVPALVTPPGGAPLLGPKPGRGAATILVVDDEPPVLAAASPRPVPHRRIHRRRIRRRRRDDPASVSG